MAQDPRVLLQKVRDSFPPLSFPRCCLYTSYDGEKRHGTDGHLLQAEKALQSASSGFSLFGGKTEKYENAADLYTQAANTFRVQKMSRDSPPQALKGKDSADGEMLLGKEAGQAFEAAASIQGDKLNERDDAANSLQEAFKVYRKAEPEDAARVLSSAISHYVLKGNLRRAATQEQHLAELYEEELGDPKRAIEAYEKAAEWFEGDNAEA